MSAGDDRTHAPGARVSIETIRSRALTIGADLITLKRRQVKSRVSKQGCGGEENAV